MGSALFVGWWGRQEQGNLDRATWTGPNKPRQAVTGLNKVGWARLAGTGLNKLGWARLAGTGRRKWRPR